MKKTLPIVAIIILLLQTVLIPVVAMAESFENEPTPLEIRQVAGELLDSQGKSVIQDNPLQKEEEQHLKITGELLKISDEEETFSLNVSQNVSLNGNTMPVMNDNQDVIGSAQVTGQQLSVMISPEIIGNQVFELSVPVTYNGTAEMADQVSIQSQLGETVVDFPIKEEAPETSESEVSTSQSSVPVESETIDTKETTEASEITETSETAKKPENNKVLSEALKGIVDNELVADIITKLEWSTYPKEGEEPTINSEYKLTFDWTLPDDIRKEMVGGETFSFNLPKELRINTPQKGKMGDFATYTVSTDGKVVITFTEKVTELQEIDGNFWLVSSLNEKEITSEEEVLINLPIKGNEHEISIPIKSTVDESLDKRGEVNQHLNGASIKWDVLVNKAKKELTNVKIIDELPKGLTIEDIKAVKVYEIEVNRQGEYVKDLAELGAGQFTVGLDGQKMSVEVLGTSKKAYRIEYLTKIDESIKPNDGGVVEFTNKVTQTSDGGKELNTEASVSAEYGKMLVKGQPQYNSDNQSFKWTVKFNYGEKTIPKGEAYIQDRFSPNMELIEDSLAVTKKDGTQLALGKDYTVVKEGNGFKLSFVDEVNYLADITYTTKIRDDIVVDKEQQEVSNSVVSVGGSKDNSGGSAVPTGLIKSNKGINYQNETTSWSIDINKSKYLMKNWSLVDTFDHQGLTFIPSTFKIVLEDGKTILKDGVDYVLDYDAGLKSGFNVKLIGAYQETKERLFITYETAYNKYELSEGKTTFRNSAVSTWKDSKGETKTFEDSAEVKPNPETLNNGSKYGEYNAVTKEITWTVNVNYNRHELTDAKIIDKINGNQNFIPGSAKLETYDVNKDGQMVKKGDVTPLVLTAPSVNNDQTLVVNLPAKSERLVYRLTFKTSLVGEVINEASTYHNLAILRVGDKDQNKLPANVSISKGGIFAEKVGHYDKNNPEQVSWKINVNESQSTIKDFTVVDEPSANQLINEDSVKVVEMTTNEKGVLTPSETVLMAGKDYQLMIEQDGVTGKEKMTIKFLKEIHRAYQITYLSHLLLQDGTNDVTNKVSVSGNNDQISVENVSKTIKVQHIDSGGSSSGKLTDYYLKKTDDHGRVLAGVTFNLLHGKTRKVVRQVTSDKDGLVHFKGILSGHYYLQEVAHKDGFFRSDRLLDGVEPIEVAANNNSFASPQIVVNVLNEVEMRKIDEAGKPLAGAVFELSKKDDTGNYQAVSDFAAVTTDKDGRLFMEGLHKGEYRLRETQAATGYIQNTKIVEFKIDGSEQKILSLPDFINYQGQVQFQKTDHEGNGLKGAKFTVLDTKQKVVQDGITSDENGLVTIKNLAPGKYTVVEAQAPVGYILNKTSQEVTIDAETNGQPSVIKLKEVVNYQGSAELEKVSEKKIHLKEAVFSLYKQDGTEIKKDLVTNSNGKIRVEGLASGEYYFQETKAPTGYILNTDKYEFTIANEAKSAPAVVTTRQAVNYQGSARLIKKDYDDERLAKAEFKVIKEDGTTVKSGLIANQDGEVVARDLAPGKYFFVETKAPKGFVINSQQIAFTIADTSLGEPVQVEAGELTNYLSKAQLLKTDEQGQPLAGAIFKVVNSQNKTVAENLRSNAQGLVEVTGLKAGDYAFVETQAAAGYLLNDAPQPFTIQPAYSGQPIVEQAGALINYQGKVVLHKVDDQEKPLAGAVFKLYKENGDVIAKELVSDKDGQVAVGELAPGKYYFEETKAPTGYLINTTKRSFEIANNSQTTVAATVVKAINYRGSAQLIKVDEADKPLADAVFKVVSKDLTDENGNDLVVRQGVKSSEEGNVSVTDLAPGRYAFVEVQAPVGYIVNKIEKEFTILTKAADQPAMVEAGTLTNYQGKLSFRKINGDARPFSLKAGLQGAEFELTQLAVSGKRPTKQILKADKTGIVEVSGLTPGRYEIKEIKAPTGFITRTKVFEFEIGSEGSGRPDNVFGNTDITFENYQGTAELIKKDNQGNGLAGAVFNVLDEQQNLVQADLVSDFQGMVKALDLAPGHYFFKEIKAPDGYILNNEQVPFTISETSESGRSDVTGLELINYQGSATLKKTDDQGNALKGAEFDLYRQNKGSDTLVEKELVSDEVGLIKVSELTPGT